MRHQVQAFQRGNSLPPGCQILPLPARKAYLRITNTLQELDLLVQFVTLFDKSRFSKEPSYLGQLTYAIRNMIDLPCRRRICDKVEGRRGSFELRIVDIVSDTLAKASFLGLEYQSSPPKGRCQAYEGSKASAAENTVSNP